MSSFVPKRGIIGGTLTVAALVLILSFKTPDTTSLAAGNGGNGGGSQPQVVGTQPAQGGAQATTGTDSGTGSAGSGSGNGTGSGTGTARGNFTGQLTGQAVQIPFGTVQVQVTMQNGKITDVRALQLPNFDRHSQEVSSYASPQLRTEALQAQSAQIDTISGATYTSEAYIQSLQSALDQAA
jgi:uncharacterized protein with FMN-binding domain